MKRKMWLVGLAVLVGLLSGCSNIKKDAAALSGDFSGKDWSGATAVIRLPGDIPGVPASKGQRARFSETEREQLLYLDADCQKQLYDQLPSWARAIVEEGGWGALAVAVGQGGFAAQFPGAAMIKYYIFGGAIIGAATGMNTGRIRQSGAESGALGYCLIVNTWEAKQRYGILQGINLAPWYGNGKTDLPAATEPRNAPTLPPINYGRMPLPK